MPEPKFVIAVGSCGLSGGVFAGCYNVLGGIDTIIPVDVYVPGCPPRPEAIIHGVLVLIEKLKQSHALPARSRSAARTAATVKSEV
jgi:NADH:ubiquinone oxidoreductase subunit B-like Fe-S oxidoreductase